MIVLCSVCFQGSDPVIRESLNAGIFVLLGITGLVLGCVAYFFFRLAQRARTSAHLVSGEPILDDVLSSIPPLGTFRK